MATRLKGWRYIVFLGSFVGSVSTFLYFTAVRPMIDPEPYSKIIYLSILYTSISLDTVAVKLLFYFRTSKRSSFNQTSKITVMK